MQPSLWTSMFIQVPAVEQPRELAAAGFRHAEISCEAISDPEIGRLSLRHAERLHAAYRAAGVTPLQVHYPLTTLNPAVPADAPGRQRSVNFAHPDEARREFEVRCAEELLEQCALLGVRAMVVHPGGRVSPEDARDREELHAHTLAAFRRLAPVAERFRVALAVENMGPGRQFPSYCAEADDLVRLCEEIGSPNVGVCLDTSHANMAKVDIPAAIRRVGPRLVATHISDNFGERDDHLMPYGGRIAWQPIVETLCDIGYAGLFNLEIPGENHCPLEVIRLKARYARALLETMLARA